MQRAKHAERRKSTRQRLELGEAVEAAGAAHLSRAEIINVLSAHVGNAVSVDHSKTRTKLRSDPVEGR